MGFVILGSNAHCFTFFYWICWKVLISTEGHAGYEFPWTPMRVIPLVAGPSYHDHHHSHNVGNYAGSCYFWDLVLDTNVPYMDDFLKS
jgi:sterol desaturase/sphingolipid hydroxylase (fatty acid hydroxylase superfamily)